MKHLKEHAEEYRVRLRDVGSAEAWGTARGALAFGKMNAQLLRLPERTLVVLDFTALARADVSFLREAVVEIVRKYRPRLLFIAMSLGNPDLQANLESALALQGESLLMRQAKSEPVVLGKKLPREHRVTLQALQRHREFTSGMLTSKPFELESSTASARLTALWRAGLVDRVQGMARSGGKEYKYFAIT
jgi:hypothetical protein